MRTTFWPHHFAARCLAILGLCLLALVSLAQTAVDRDARPVILAIGESTTAGFGVPAGKSYPAQLQALLDAKGYAYRVVNHGHSGSTTAMALAGLDRGMQLRPEIVLIALGGNDRGTAAAARTKDNLRKLVSLHVRSGARVFLAERTAANDGGDASRLSLYAELAREERAMLMPSLRQDVAGHPELLLSDMSHPNADGYALVAQRIFAMLEPFLKR